MRGRDMSTTTLATTSGISAAAPPARRSGSGLQTEPRAFKIVTRVVLTIFAVLWLLPTLWAIRTSLVSNATASLGAEAVLKDTNPTLHSYSVLLQSGDIWNWYVASAVTSVLTVVLTVLFASMAGYVLSRMRFRGRWLVFMLVVLGIMVPTQVLIVPIFRELSAMHLLNTYWSVILPQVISAVGILTFVSVWNNLILPLYTLTNPKLMTIPVGLATVQGSYGQRLADIQASAILGALPLVILYFFFQRRIVEGFAGSG